MERKLTTIQQITNIQPIAGADRIVQATVMGWTVVVGKDHFKNGDLCVFFEVDSLLPDGKEWSEFMRPRKFRIKTCKLKGVLSQGLALPISIMPADFTATLTIGLDVTATLHVKKYELPVKDTGTGKCDQKCEYINLIPKTDELRLQSNLDFLENLRGRPYVATVKIDGSSMTVCYDRDGEFHVMSRNWSLLPDFERPNKYWEMAIKHQLAEKLKGTTFAIQGELCGLGIQKNRMKFSGNELLVFNIFDWKERTYLKHDLMVEKCRDFGLTPIPVAFREDSFNKSMEDLLELARGKYDNTDNNREGIVLRSAERDGSFVSFKVLNNDFLLADED